MPLPFVDRSNSSLPVQFVLPSEVAVVAERAERGAPRLAGIARRCRAMPATSPCCRAATARRAGAVLVLSAKPTLWDFGALGDETAGRHVEARRHRAGLADRCRRRDRSRDVALRALQGEEGQGRAEDPVAAGRRQGARDGDDRVDLPGARSHHHAVVRHGAGRARRGGAGARQEARRQDQGHGRRRSAEAELPDDPCGRPRQRARAAADRSHLGQGAAIPR